MLAYVFMTVIANIKLMQCFLLKKMTNNKNI